MLTDRDAAFLCAGVAGGREAGGAAREKNCKEHVIGEPGHPGETSENGLSSQPLTSFQTNKVQANALRFHRLPRVPETEDNFILKL